MDHRNPEDYGTAYFGLTDLLGELTPAYTQACKRWGVDPVEHMQGVARDVAATEQKFQLVDSIQRRLPI